MIFSEQHRQMLAVLAPYLQYEIEVETRARGRGTLVGLPFCQAPCEKPRAEVRLYSGGCDEVLDLADVKPVLFAFEDLVHPLADGLVPAVEAARFAGAIEFFTDNLTAQTTELIGFGPCVVIYVNRDTNPTGKPIFWIYKHKTALMAAWPCAIADAQEYLRFNHFAVGLSHSQFIRKAPAYPTQKERDAA